MKGPDGAITSSSVMIEPEIDDDQVHIDTLVAFLTRPVGLDLRKTNRVAYEALKTHLRMHQMILTQKTITQTETPPGENPESSSAGVEE